MASHDTSALGPETPVSSGTNPRRSRSSFFRNRFSNPSLLSLSTVRTLLPQYTVIDTSDPLPSPLSEITTVTGNQQSLSCSPTSSWNSPSEIEPPRYSLLHSPQLNQRVSTTPTPFEADSGDSEAYGFTYSYPNRPKNPWATLHLYTRDAVPGTHSKPLENRPRVPRFWSCDPIKGSLQLDLDSPQSIQRITMTLTGNVILSAQLEGSLRFLSRELTVWDQSMGDPLQSSNSTVAQKKKIDRLAAGQYIFPFSFPFPTHAEPVMKTADSIPDANSISPFTVGDTLSNVPPSPSEKPQRRWSHRRSTSASHESPSSLTSLQPSSPTELSQTGLVSAMPPTFLEKDINSTVVYSISVRIVHGRFNACSKIKTNISYFPASEPLPASQKRRDAYEAGALAPCPMDDPEGWFAFPTVAIYGAAQIGDDLLHTRVDLTLYIAQPLSYTRGCHIPCFITIHSDAIEIAHLLSGAPTVRLLRRVWHPLANFEEIEMYSGGHSILGSGAYMRMSTSDIILVSHEVGCANWWTPSKEIVQGSNTRHLEGEIHLSPDLQPSCGFQSFRIEYAVELLSFQTATFTPEVQSPLPGMLRKVIASNPVEITTLFRQDEPVPTAFSEPPEIFNKRRISLDTSANF